MADRVADPAVAHDDALRGGRARAGKSGLRREDRGGGDRRGAAQRDGGDDGGEEDAGGGHDGLAFLTLMVERRDPASCRKVGGLPEIVTRAGSAPRRRAPPPRR